MTPAGAFVAGCVLSALGTGAVYPVNVVYLHLERGLPVALVGLCLTGSAVAALISAPVAGRLVERLGARTVTMLALAAQAAGAAAMIPATSVPAAAAALAVQGVGNGAFYAALTPLVAEITDGARRLRLLSWRYAINNAGIGLGAVLGGLLITRHGLAGYLGIYAANAVSFLAFAALLGAVPKAVRTGQRGPGYLRVLADPAARRLMLIQLLIVSCGYAQLDSSVPLFAAERLGLSAAVIGAVIATNTVLVVLLQAPATRWAANRDPRVVLRALGLLWCGAMLVGAATGVLPVVALFLAVVIFSVGECLYTPGFQGALIDLAGEDGLGRYSALAGMTWTVALLGAPALGIVLAQVPWPPAYWLILALAAAAVSVLAGRSSDARVARQPG